LRRQTVLPDEDNRLMTPTRWTSAPSEARSEFKAHAGQQIARPRIRTESPLWTPRRSDFGRIVREPTIVTPTPHIVPVAPGHYDELDLIRDPDGRTLWCFMRPHERPSFTPSLLRELIGLRRALQGAAYSTTCGETLPRYFVGGSRLPGIYNLGGDLAYFTQKIRAQDRAGLRRYAHDCVDVGYHMWTGFDLPIVTIAMVQGDALGGGFEGALSFNVVVAERSSKFGMPEILFNLFPGMGAYSFISRKLDAASAERMILSGQIYSAEELHRIGLIDVLAEDGEGEAAVRDYIARNSKHHMVRQSIRDVRNRVLPLALGELNDIADIWVEHALRLEESDLRKMERLRAAQDRRLASQKA
jgi:DSF synthase